MRSLAGCLSALAMFTLVTYIGQIRNPVRVAKAAGRSTVASGMCQVLSRWRAAFRRNATSPLWEEIFYSVAFHLKAGETLPQAIRGVSEEGSDGPYEALRKAARAYEAGATTLQALQSASAGSFEYERLAEAVEVGLSAGSDMPALLCHTAENLAKRRALRREARAKITESRLTAAVLSAMPWLIGAITYWHDPGLLVQALSGARGRLVLWCSLGLWAAGNVAIFATLAAVTTDKSR